MTIIETLAGAITLVHGIFGTLCVGLFGVKGVSGLPADGLLRGGGFAQLGPQVEAVVTVGAFSFGTSLLVWHAIKKTMGLRVSEPRRRGRSVAPERSASARHARRSWSRRGVNGVRESGGASRGRGRQRPGLRTFRLVIGR
jgi:hypothetical protein